MTRTSVPRPHRAASTAALRAVVGLPGAGRRGAGWLVRRFAVGLALAALLAGRPGVPAPVSGAAYDRFYANFAGEELMRAINADRAAVGRSALASDSTLESLARDRPVACPADAGLTIRGRARDMAERGYFSHTIPGCPAADGAFTAFDLLTAAGYTVGSVGEDIAQNDYPSTAASYATGCDLSGKSCSGSITLPWTVAVAQRGFMSSQAHRDNLLSATYGRFGCGAWQSSGGRNVYACYFVASGNGTLDGTAPNVGQVSGAGAVFAAGSTPSFTAVASDAASVLADGWAAIDGVHIRSWAWDHAGSSAALSATAKPLTSGRHTFTWWVRDASSRSRAVSFVFTVSGAPSATPRPTPTATPAHSQAATPSASTRPRATRAPQLTSPAPSPPSTDPGSSTTPSPNSSPSSSAPSPATVPSSAPLGSISSASTATAPPGAEVASAGEDGSSWIAAVVALAFTAAGAAILLTSGGRPLTLRGGIGAAIRRRVRGSDRHRR